MLPIVAVVPPAIVDVVLPGPVIAHGVVPIGGFRLWTTAGGLSP
jgi:hypothetical protein